MWSSNDIILRRINDTMATTVDSLLVYTASYNISQLSTTDDGRVISCEVVINTNTSIMVSNNFTLSVDGEYCSVRNPIIY